MRRPASVVEIMPGGIVSFVSSLFTPIVIRTSSPARRQVGDVGLERRVPADVLGDLGAVDVDHALVGGGIHTQHHAFAGPPARHPHRPLVPDPADVVADRLVGEHVVVAGRDRGLEGGLELVGPRLGGGGVVEREAPQSVEADRVRGWKWRWA